MIGALLASLLATANLSIANATINLADQFSGSHAGAWGRGINGRRVLVPQIYLSQVTRDNIKIHNGSLLSRSHAPAWECILRLAFYKHLQQSLLSSIISGKRSIAV